MHRRRGSTGGAAPGTGSHFSKPVTMPPTLPVVNIRPGKTVGDAGDAFDTNGSVFQLPDFIPPTAPDMSTQSPPPPQQPRTDASTYATSPQGGDVQLNTSSTSTGATKSRIDLLPLHQGHTGQSLPSLPPRKVRLTPQQQQQQAQQQAQQHQHQSSTSQSQHSAKLKKQITKVVAITKLNAPVKASKRRKRVKDGQVVFKGHKSWEIVLSIQFGLQYTSDLLQNSEDTEPTVDDFRESLAFDFNPIDDQRSASVFDVNKYAKWVHPAPYVYRRIRAKFGVSEQEFLDATCSESRVRELPTPGKSGALFYITDDENYFMKTITHEEEKLLLSMLPAYYAHVCTSPQTFLTRYLAHFSVQTTRNRHIRMVVMASVFNDSIFIDKKYDLKGSTFKRMAKPEELQSENVTLKDLDFDAPIFFNPDVVEQIHDQLAKDTAFLDAHHVMDYSLLLGMSEMIPEEASSYREAYGSDEEAGPYYIGYQSNADGEVIGHRICIGIIDFLQRFRTRKKVEYGCRVMQTCSAGDASVAPPRLYRSRFLAFLKTRLLPDPNVTAPGAAPVGTVLPLTAASPSAAGPTLEFLPAVNGRTVDTVEEKIESVRLPPNKLHP
jgi:hypothetical protein